MPTNLANFRVGNCPVCGLCITCVGHGKTPRHGHVRNDKHGSRVPGGKLKWLPACSGSGKLAANIYPEL